MCLIVLLSDGYLVLNLPRESYKILGGHLPEIQKLVLQSTIQIRKVISGTSPHSWLIPPLASVKCIDAVGSMGTFTQ